MPSKGPAIVMSLLVAMLGLSAGAIALIIYFNANRPDSKAIAAACKGEVGAAISRESNKVTAACEAAAAKSGPNTVPVAEGAHQPGFSYPATWSAFQVITDTDDGAKSYSTYVDPGLLSFAPGWAGAGAAMTINVEPKNVAAITKAGSLKNYVAAFFASPLQAAATFEETTINGFPVVVVKGVKNEMVETSFEEKVVYQGAKDIVWVNIQSVGSAPGETEVSTSWEDIKASLNFSKIE